MNTTPSLVEAAEDVLPYVRDSGKFNARHAHAQLDAALAAHQSREAALMECVEILKVYRATVGNTGASITRDGAAELYAVSGLALKQLDQLGG